MRSASFLLSVAIVGAATAAVLDIAGTQAQTDDPNSAPKPQWEFPRLCRGGSKSLTYPAVDTAAPSTKLRIASRQAHEEGFD
jgi:hypothetical protein